jgi:hypothetical protein
VASRLDAWLKAGDIGAVVQATRTSTVMCPGGRPSGAGGPFPVCDGAAAGETRTGVGVARRYSEGATLSVDGYRALVAGFLAAVNPAATDASGSGALRLAALSCLDPAEAPAACTRTAVIFSAIARQASLPGAGIPGGRELLIFYVDTASAGSSTPIRTTWTGIVQDPERPILFETGGTLFDLGRVFVLR